MAEKRRPKQVFKRLRDVRTWQLVVLLILVGFIAATFLRLNSIGIVQRREAVLSADKQGEQEVMIKRLYDLQHYVSSHMNTDLGRGVYLETTYGRDVQKWQETQYGSSNPNGDIFKKAQEVCAPQFSGYSLAYLTCVTNELSKYPEYKINDEQTGKPRQEAYIHNFSSPKWTPDFAGWAVLVFFGILLVIVTRLISLAVLQILLKRQYRRI